jgi:hypothetical protein
MFYAINHWYNVTDMCIYVTFSGLLIKKDQIPTIEAKELTVLTKKNRILKMALNNLCRHHFS